MTIGGRSPIDLMVSLWVTVLLPTGTRSASPTSPSCRDRVPIAMLPPSPAPLEGADERKLAAYLSRFKRSIWACRMPTLTDNGLVAHRLRDSDDLGATRVACLRDPCDHDNHGRIVVQLKAASVRAIHDGRDGFIITITPSSDWRWPRPAILRSKCRTSEW